MGIARKALGGLVIVAVIGLAYAALMFVRRSAAEECYACRRPIHAHSRTVAVANGKSRLFCCPACALSEQTQEGKPVEVKELTAFLTGAKLSPDTAYVVKGSDVNMCARAHELVDADKHAADLHYDRCAPSLLAFANPDEAANFAREHGGAVLPFREVAASLARTTPVH